MLESEAIMKRTAHLLALLVLFSTVSAQYVEPWGATRALRMKEAAKLHDELSAMVLMWAEVASRLPDTQLWQAVDHLVERKIVSKKAAEDFGHSFLAANATLRSQAILNAVVMPYLRGDLNCQ